MSHGLALLLSCASASTLIALPISFGKNLPLKSGFNYNLEIARDEGFERVLVKAVVQGAPLFQDLQQEGIYHYRLSPQSEQSADATASTMISGSFVLLLAETKSKSLTVNVSWQAYAGADRYQVTTRKTDGTPISALHTTGTQLILERQQQPVYVEIEPRSGGEKASEGFYILSGLKLQLPEADPTIAPPIKLPSTTPAAVSVTPSPAPSLSTRPAEEPPTPTVVESQDRDQPRHRIVFQQTFWADDITLESTLAEIKGSQQQSGLGLGFLAQPNYGLFIGGSFDYHDFDGILEQSRKDQSQQQDIYAYFPRQNLQLLAGWDVFSPFKTQKHFLGLYAAGNMAIFPGMESEPAFDGSVRLSLQREQSLLAGGGAIYRYFYRGFSAGVQFSSVINDRKNASINSGQLTMEFYIDKGVVINAGFLGRDSRFHYCPEGGNECDEASEYKTSLMEYGVFVGVGAFRY